MADSLSLTLPAAKQSDGNAVMEALLISLGGKTGCGANTFSVGLSPGGAPGATHYGCHTYDDDLGDIVASGTLPGGITWANYGLNQGQAQAALSAMAFSSVAGNASVVNFTAHASGQGVERIPA